MKKCGKHHKKVHASCSVLVSAEKSENVEAPEKERSHYNHGPSASVSKDGQNLKIELQNLVVVVKVIITHTHTPAVNKWTI